MMPTPASARSAIAIVVLAAVLAVSTDGFFSGANLTDLFLANVPVLSPRSARRWSS